MSNFKKKIKFLKIHFLVDFNELKMHFLKKKTSARVSSLTNNNNKE